MPPFALPGISATLTAPTGFCGPLEMGPVCYTPLPPGPDAFSGGIATSHDRSVTRGMLSYFGRTPSPAAMGVSALPPFDRELSLSDYRDQFPTEMQPVVADLFRFQTEFNSPLSFRIVNAQLSNGDTIPQIYFFRTGDTPELPAFRGGGPSGPGGNSPEPTTAGLTVSLFGGSLAVVALDRLLFESLVEHGIMPAEARAPAVFTTVMTAHYALNWAGVVESTPMQGLQSMPSFMGFQFLARLLFEKLGVEPGFATDVGALTLAAVPFYLARQSPMLADALTAANAGKGFELAGLAPEAATLRVGAAFARVLGEIGIIDIGARIGTWGIGRIVAATSSGDYDNNVRTWDLIRLSQDLINQEDFGSVAAGMFGSIMTFDDVVLSWFDDDFDRDYQGRLESTYMGLAAGSDDFGEAMNQSLLAIVRQNTRPGSDSRMTVDWEGVQRDVRAFYQDERNSENIGNGYDLVDGYTAPLTASGVSELIDVVDRDGEIADLAEFRAYVFRRASILQYKPLVRLESRSLELGLAEDVNGVRISLIPTDPARMESFRASLTPEQRDFLEGEGQVLALEIMSLSLLEEATDPQLK